MRQMTKEQCIAMLWPTAKTMPKGTALARNHHGSFPFLGDLVDKRKSWLVSCRGVGDNTADEIMSEVRKLTGFIMPTHFDNRTALAYMEAKEAIDKGISMEDAWPDWYLEGKPAPTAASE